VAHSESRYSDVKMLRSEWTSAEARTDDYGPGVQRLYPNLDLEAMRLNTHALCNASAMILHAIAPDVRRRKPLRRLS
jgi:hypothetical protein